MSAPAGELFGRSKQAPSFCKRCPCSEFLAVEPTENSRYSGHERCLTCPHKARQHAWEETKQKITKRLRFDATSPPAKSYDDYSPDDTENHAELSSPFRRIPVVHSRISSERSPSKNATGKLLSSASPKKALPKFASPQRPQQSPWPQRGSSSKHDLSSSPFSHGDTSVRSLPPTSKPSPIGGSITLKRFYKYFRARSDYTDHLCNRILQQNQSGTDENAALLNGLSLDIAMFQERMKDVRRKLDQITEHYWKERLLNQRTEGRGATLVTPGQSSFSESATSVTGDKTVSTPATVKKKPPRSRMNDEWLLELSRLRRQNTPPTVRTTISPSVKSTPGTLAADSSVGYTSFEGALLSEGGEQEGVKEQYQDGGDEKSELGDESQQEEGEEGPEEGLEEESEESEEEFEESDTEESDTDHSEVESEVESEEEADDGETREEERVSSTEIDEGADEKDNEEGDEGSEARSDEGYNDEYDEESSEEYHDHLGRKRNLKKLYSGALPMLTPIKEESFAILSKRRLVYESPTIKSSSVGNTILLSSETKLGVENRKLVSDLISLKEESKEQGKNRETRCEKEGQDLQGKTVLQTEHLSSLFKSSSGLHYSQQNQNLYSETVINPDSDSIEGPLQALGDELDIPITKRKRESATFEKRNPRKRAHIEELEDPQDEGETNNESSIVSGTAAVGQDRSNATSAEIPKEEDSQEMDQNHDIFVTPGRLDSANLVVKSVWQKPSTPQSSTTSPSALHAGENDLQRLRRGIPKKDTYLPDADVGLDDLRKHSRHVNVDGDVTQKEIAPLDNVDSDRGKPHALVAGSARKLREDSGEREDSD